VVDEGSKNDEANDEEEHQQAELIGARTKRLDEDLQAACMMDSRIRVTLR